ncbi:MAG: hypothetical protein KAS17_00095, partial [Victivallaceae bacterium]|nr:hypothetical protein [Victivallaceae bacterium]
MKNEKIINIHDFISHSENISGVNSSSIFAVGFNIFTRNILKFIIAGILPFAALIFTSISEYSINKSGVINWMRDEFAFSAFQFTLYIIRFIAFGAVISSWSWLAGEIIFRDTSSPPPLSESINAGWKYAFRTALATLLLWMLITVYAQFVFILCKAAWVIFIPAGYTAATAAFILVASWTILPAL